MIAIFDYKENGESRTFKLEIDFISRGVRRRLREILSNIEAAKIKFAERNRLYDELAELKNAKSKDKSKITEIQNKIILIEDSFREYNDIAIEEDYIDIIRRVLKDNGIKEDHKMFDDNFMDSCVTSGTLVRFMLVCWAIDYPVKKNEVEAQR